MVCWHQLHEVDKPLWYDVWMALHKSLTQWLSTLAGSSILHDLNYCRITPSEWKGMPTRHDGVHGV